MSDSLSPHFWQCLKAFLALECTGQVVFHVHNGTVLDCDVIRCRKVVRNGRTIKYQITEKLTVDLVAVADVPA